MLLLTTKKSGKSCCGNCADSKPCCGSKYTATPSGLLLPDRRLFAPRASLWPARHEGLATFGPLDPMLVRFDMSCLPCCGGVVTNCCPDRVLPTTLHGEFISACACFNYATPDLIYTAIGGGPQNRWVSPAYDDPCSNDFTIVQVWCNATQEENGPGDVGWHMEKLTSAQCSIPHDNVNEPTGTCDPLELEFAATISGTTPCTGCVAGTDVVFVVTE